jgi:hypothetical protein
MSTASFNGLLIIIGPSVLAWVKVDQPVAVMALLGLAFLLFLAGLEVDLQAMTPVSCALRSPAMPARCCSGPSRASPSTRRDGSATAGRRRGLYRGPFGRPMR